MKINSIKLAKLYSFGPLQEIKGFSTFNLFIGPNGSGKTNIFRVLSGLPYDFTKIGEVRVQSQTHTAGLVEENVTAFRPQFHEMSVTNNEARSSDIDGYLEINYQTITSVHQTTPENKKILCADSADGHMEFKSGDVFSYARRVAFISLPETDYEFFKDIGLFINRSDHWLNILNFGLNYIFGLHYYFKKSGEFVQGKNSGGGTVENDFQTLPSGVLQVAKLLVRILLAQGRAVLLIDEPELHIEPRFLRALFEFLVWYVSRSKNNIGSSEAKLVDRVNMKLNENARFSNLIPDSLGNTLHVKQIFISSHSSVLINEFLHLEDSASIYEFNLEECEYVQTMGKVAQFHNFGNAYKKQGLFSSVRKVGKHPSSIFDSLGCKGADLLQCNGVVWVEGPSDVIYLDKWLKMHSEENALPVLRRGIDFEFQMYGGTLLDSICLIKNGSDEAKEQRKLVSMFSFSRNAYVLADSDAVFSDDGSVVDKSNFFAAKKFIQSEINRLNSQGYKLGMWYAENDTELRTIEDYLDEDSLGIAISSTKKIAAQKRVATWTEKKLNDFPAPLSTEIAKLEHICTW